jgi:predicted glycoside hydrolase/deacetylase ChbG (UPF0249 family)
MIQKLIVNADDYGHTPGISEGIRRAHLQGIVTSTTAMMNRPAAVAELPTAMSLCPKLGLGVHLVLTTGVPLLPGSRIPSLVDPAGRFYRQEPIIKRLSIINPDEAAAEWHAQVELFVKITGRLPDHLDSHHHHTCFTPALFERLLRLAEELGCPIRNPFMDVSVDAREYLPEMRSEDDLTAVQNLLARFKPKSPQHFISNFYDETVSLGHLQALLQKVAAAPAPLTWELMCHPAVVDDELRRVSDYNDKRGQELAVLTHPGLPNLLKSLQIELISFQMI